MPRHTFTIFTGGVIIYQNQLYVDLSSFNHGQGTPNHRVPPSDCPSIEIYHPSDEHKLLQMVQTTILQVFDWSFRMSTFISCALGHQRLEQLLVKQTVVNISYIIVEPHICRNRTSNFQTFVLNNSMWSCSSGGLKNTEIFFRTYPLPD